jgi:hypothetical protein
MTVGGTLTIRMMLPEWLETQLLMERPAIGPLRPAIMDGFVLIKAFLPVGGIHYDAFLFNPLDAAPGPLFANHDIRANRESIVLL